MAQISKFVYALIIFFSLILAVTNAGLFRCKVDIDCPQILCFDEQIAKCIARMCECDYE
ncbi:putative Late nodulin [Medicago truncatula]|uniref:Nodule Cysteine-Rich (NCR) secreted peptide n=1 Tax=Medicago truncatula TaxID=3880 RepID=A0A072UU77_MEDTR|nr:Nodule Cysteine-Rich (NCR) secreted peptide [Medicago truncatula]RHN66684.1 putative Late nodulin [Medicago truncatula]